MKKGITRKVKEQTLVPLEPLIHEVRGVKVILSVERSGEAQQWALPGGFYVPADARRTGRFDIANCDVKEGAGRTTHPAVCLYRARCDHGITSAFREQIPQR